MGIDPAKPYAAMHLRMYGMVGVTCVCVCVCVVCRGNKVHDAHVGWGSHAPMVGLGRERRVMVWGGGEGGMLQPGW